MFKNIHIVAVICAMTMPFSQGFSSSFNEQYNNNNVVAGQPKKADKHPTKELSSDSQKPVEQHKKKDVDKQPKKHNAVKTPRGM